MRPVEKMPRVGLSEDGRSVIVVFAVSGGETVELEFDAKLLESVIQDLGPVLRLSHERSDPGKQGVVAVQPTQYRVNMTDDNKQVLLSFRHQNNLESHFAFGPKDAGDLGQKIIDATTPSKKPPKAKGRRH